MTPAVAYKIIDVAEWREAVAEGAYAGSAVDLADGYIHFSTALQVRETAHRHFTGQPDLMLVGVDPAKLGDALKWEPSRGGQLFPHLYGPLPMTAVLFAEPLPVDAAGYHVFPASIR